MTRKARRAIRDGGKVYGLTPARFAGLILEELGRQEIPGSASPTKNTARSSSSNTRLGLLGEGACSIGESLCLNCDRTIDPNVLKAF
jgi:hypothetical protein